MAASGPHRTCIGCRAKAPVDQLVRYVRSDDGEVQIARHGHGRGAWVCATDTCLDAAVRSGAFSRAFRASSRLSGA